MDRRAVTSAYGLASREFDRPIWNSGLHDWNACSALGPANGPICCAHAWGVGDSQTNTSSAKLRIVALPFVIESH
jgi:hypothetical protein